MKGGGAMEHMNGKDREIELEEKEIYHVRRSIVITEGEELYLDYSYMINRFNDIEYIKMRVPNNPKIVIPDDIFEGNYAKYLEMLKIVVGFVLETRCHIYDDETINGLAETIYNNANESYELEYTFDDKVERKVSITMKSSM